VWSHYRLSVAQRVGEVKLYSSMTAALEGSEWSAARPGHTLPPVPILQQAGWASGPVWMGRKSRPHHDSILNHPAYSQSLYWQSYPAHNVEENAQIWKLRRKCKRGTKLGKFNSRKIKRRSDKINKYSLDKERWNGDMTWIRGNGAACINEVKEESRHVLGNVQSNLSPT